MIVFLRVDNRFAVSSAHDSSLFIWDVTRQRMVSSILAHSAKLVCLDYSFQIDLIASVDITGKSILDRIDKKYNAGLSA